MWSQEKKLMLGPTGKWKICSTDEAGGNVVETELLATDRERVSGTAKGRLRLQSPFR